MHTKGDDKHAADHHINQLGADNLHHDKHCADDDKHAADHHINHLGANNLHHDNYRTDNGVRNRGGILRARINCKRQP